MVRHSLKILKSFWRFGHYAVVFACLFHYFMVYCSVRIFYIFIMVLLIFISTRQFIYFLVENVLYFLSSFGLPWLCFWPYFKIRFHDLWWVTRLVFSNISCQYSPLLQWIPGGIFRTQPNMYYGAFLWTILQKSSIVHVLLGSKFASVSSILSHTGKH